MNNTDKIIDFLHYHPGISRQELMDGLDLGVKDTQVKKFLSSCIADGFVRTEGKARATRYFITPKAHLLRTIDLDTYYATPIANRAMQTSYNFELIREELPRVDILTADERKFLSDCEVAFRERMKDMPRAIYLKEMERLGIDLSWKSSEIEGNTYTLLETVNLLKDKIEAKGKKREEAIMLLNHKAALNFILDEPDYLQTLSIRNIEDIHALLVKDLDVDKGIRRRRVGITGTNYRPLDNEFQIREALDSACRLINGKTSIFEKALLTLVLLSYIQAFADGNKRTARISSNAILIANGYCPISFRTVDSIDYKKAMLLFYEQNNICAFKDIFIDQYEFAVKNYF